MHESDHSGSDGTGHLSQRCHIGLTTGIVDGDSALEHALRPRIKGIGIGT